MSESPAPSTPISAPPVADAHEMWLSYTHDERIQAFTRLSSADAEEVFVDLDVEIQAELLLALDAERQKAAIRLLAPDDTADLIQKLPLERRDEHHQVARELAAVARAQQARPGLGDGEVVLRRRA